MQIKKIVSRFYKIRKCYRRIIIWGLIISLLVLLIPYIVVRFSNTQYIYSSADSLPETKAGVLLGTSKYIKGGRLNPYYWYRIEAAVELIKKGKIKYIIVSGDNRHLNYNEPVQMRDDLISRGIDSNVIVLDYAGFRTLDSIIRAKKVFGLDTFIVISQPFHTRRAIFIARFRKINAIAYNAKDVGFPYGIKVQFREVFARVKLMIDLLILNKQPKFLGEKIQVGS